LIEVHDCEKVICLFTITYFNHELLLNLIMNYYLL